MEQFLENQDDPLPETASLLSLVADLKHIDEMRRMEENPQAGDENRLDVIPISGLGRMV